MEDARWQRWQHEQHLRFGEALAEHVPPTCLDSRSFADSVRQDGKFFSVHEVQSRQFDPSQVAASCVQAAVGFFGRAETVFFGR